MEKDGEKKSAGENNQQQDYINMAIKAHVKAEEEFKNSDEYKQQTYLDEVTQRIQGFKMKGKPLSPQDILGADSTKAEELFNLEEFSPKVQSEIVTQLAYFRSDAYKSRCASSLGYNNPMEEMSPNDKEIYDRMVSAGEDAYKNINFKVADNPLNSKYFREYEEERGELYIPTGKEKLSKPFNSLGIVSHEMAHHIYLRSIDDYSVNPGKNEEVLEELYGKENAPLQKLTDDELDSGKFLSLYKNLFTSKEAKDLFDSQIKNGTVDEEKYKDQIVQLLNAKKDIPEALEETAEHDKLGMERAADIHLTRMLLLQEGIWNPFSGEPVKKSDLEKLRKRHPDCRIFEYWGENTKAAYFLNNIAEVDQSKETIRNMYVKDNPDGSHQLTAKTDKGTMNIALADRDYSKLMSLDDRLREKYLRTLFKDKELVFDSLAISSEIIDMAKKSPDVAKQPQKTSEANVVASMNYEAEYQRMVGDEKSQSVGRHMG